MYAPEPFFLSNTLTYEYNSSTAANTWFYTQGLNLTAGTSYRLTFKYGNNSSTWIEKLEVKYGASPSAAAMSDLIVDYPNISLAGAAISSTDFIPSTTGVYYIGFYAYSAADQYNLYVDDISVTVTPTCDAPTNVVHSNITTTGAQLDWTPPVTGSPISYHIYHSTSSTAPGSSASPNDSTSGASTFTLTALTPGTKYFVWVRSNCGGGDISAWSLSDSFYTMCNAANLPYFEGFETSSPPQIPPCVSIENEGTGNNWETVDAPETFFPSKTLVYQYSSTDAADAWFYTQGLNLTGGVLYRLAFRYGNNDNTQYTESLEVKYGTAANHSAMTDLIVDYPTISYDSAAVSITDFTPATTGVYYIGFHAYSAANQWNLYVDSISVDSSRTVPVTLSSFKGEREGAVNVLSWTTQTEANNSGFDLERSADGRSFSKIAFVATKAPGGNSSSTLNYGYTDAKPFARTSYYRLKQTDKDGRYKYSNIVSVNGVRTTELVLSRVYPNPASTTLNVALNAPANQKVTLIITDLAGKVMMQQQTQLASGDNNIALNIARIPSGSYMLKAVCSNGCETAVTKVVKQ